MEKKIAVAATALAASLVAPMPASAQEEEAAPAPIAYAVPPCRLGGHGGIEDADAQTAASLVCAEVSHAGAPLDARYRVMLGKLGSILILQVAREGAQPGTTVDSREIRLQGIEEVSVAAPRIAESIVHGTPLKETEKVDNLVLEETRAPKTKPGKSHFTFGLVGALPPLDRGMEAAPGVSVGLHYETKSFEIGGDLRGGGSSGSQSLKTSFVMLSIGARYFTSDSNVSPYAGGGLSWDGLNLHLPNGFGGDNSGLGAYADAGVEMLRTHHAHLAFGARLDLPFFALSGNDDVALDSSGYGSRSTPARSSFYYAPLSLEARLTF